MLKRALKSIKKMHKDAAFIAITGDISDNGKKLSYKKLKTIAKKSKIEILPILGNHDCRENFAYYFPNFLEDGFVQYSKLIDNYAFIFLDTLSIGNAYGELCSSRLKWLKEQLDKFKDKHIYLFMHHHPIDCGLYAMDNKANFKSADEFWELLLNYSNIKHITFGHIHGIQHSVKYGITMHSTRSTTFQVAYLPTTTREFLTNEEPTYAIVTIDNEGNITIRHHQFLTEERIFIGRC
jgi:3',5'-cyclic AMP phosphodiesterase CpdA